MYLQVFFNSGLTNNKDDFELCLRAENVELPKSGYFGVSAATGGLAGNFNGHYLTQSYTLDIAISVYRLLGGIFLVYFITSSDFNALDQM